MGQSISYWQSQSHWHELPDEILGEIAGQSISHWQELSDEILGEIAFYLKPGDVFNASLVCKNWCRVLKSSPVWIHRSFYLNGTEHDKVAIDYVAKYGHRLKSVRLDFVVSHDNNEIETFQDNFREFLSSFNRKLISISSLSVCSSDGASVDGSVFGEALAKFLQTQKDLEVFELKAAHFNLPVPVVISILSALDKTSLRQLTLQKFTTLPGRLCRMPRHFLETLNSAAAAIRTKR